jgi:hypothetical protein
MRWGRRSARRSERRCAAWRSCGSLISSESGGGGGCCMLGLGGAAGQGARGCLRHGGAPHPRSAIRGGPDAPALKPPPGCARACEHGYAGVRAAQTAYGDPPAGAAVTPGSARRRGGPSRTLSSAVRRSSHLISGDGSRTCTIALLILSPSLPYVHIHDSAFDSSTKAGRQSASRTLRLVMRDPLQRCRRAWEGLGVRGKRAGHGSRLLVGGGGGAGGPVAIPSETRWRRGCGPSGSTWASGARSTAATRGSRSETMDLEAAPDGAQKQKTSGQRSPYRAPLPRDPRTSSPPPMRSPVHPAPPIPGAAPPRLGASRAPPRAG